MLNKLSQFFRLVKFEIIRVMRNKFVFIMFLIFPTLFLFSFYLVQMNESDYPIAICTNNVNLEEAGVVQLIKDNLKTGDIVYVDSKEDGIDKVKANEVCFFILLIPGETVDQTTAKFFYDESNVVGRNVANKLSNAKNEYAYQTIKDFLSNYGITINETYFQMISFETASEVDITLSQMSFSLEVACCISLILMLGLAYSLARDNETKISKNIAYIPVGINKYLLSKVFPYAVLGVFEISITYLLGIVLFDTAMQTNFIVMVALSIFFVLAICMLGLLFSLLKSQISTIFLDMLVILLPIFVLSSIYVNTCPLITQIFLYMLPITPFITFINCMIYNGIVLWWCVPIFVAQIVVYYLISYFILKKKVVD